jgi:hypothetical protein
MATILAGSGLYLALIRLVGWLEGRTFENRLSLIVFLGHVVVGLVFIPSIVVFALAHLRRAIRHPNRRAVHAGLTLFAVVATLIVSGILLIRLEGLIDLEDPRIRSLFYWLHSLSPLVAAWFFVLHRLAGPSLRWRIGARFAAAVLAGVGMLGAIRALSPWLELPSGPPPGTEASFTPGLSAIADGRLIPARELDNNDYCRECHGEVHARWSSSAHRLSSFNNPAYRFSVLETRQTLLARDGSVAGSAFCAVCHDPVPLFSGRFGDVEFDLGRDQTAASGITCSICHSVVEISSPRGNGDYVLARPQHYPFTFSSNAALRWINRQLVKAKPELHKATYLKPLHRSAEFCGACHKVHIPPELNRYRWLRGQNHYDSFLLSGVSGHGVSSFYYPAVAAENCSECHMPLRRAIEFGARHFDDSGNLSVHDHLFPAANTAVPMLANLDNAAEVVAEHAGFLRRAVRVDLFGLRVGGTIDGRLIAPIRPHLAQLEPGRRYLVEVVLRTVGVGHHLTEGTADSNQLWLEVSASSDGTLLGQSGAMDEMGRVDPYAHFVNAYVIDREGRRIDRRNVQDVLVALYNNQIPPGAAAVVHYGFDVPRSIDAPIELHASLKYRKFDSIYLNHILGAEVRNELPVVTMAEDVVTLPISGRRHPVVPQEPPASEWERWNDYGIGLLLRGGRGELRQAEEAFRRVESMGRAEGALNLARVFIREGRVARDAPEALVRAAAMDPPSPQWSLLWFGGLVDLQNGHLERAIRNFEQIVEGGFEEALGRNFDFSRDYRVFVELGRTLYLRALQERGPSRRAPREQMLQKAVAAFRQVLTLDPENLSAHWGLKQAFDALGERESAAHHEVLHARYKPDDNARDRAITAARRRDAAADHAARAIVIHELN